MCQAGGDPAQGCPFKICLRSPGVSVSWILTSMLLTWKHSMFLTCRFWIVNRLLNILTRKSGGSLSSDIRIYLKTRGACAIADVLLHLHSLTKTWEKRETRKRNDLFGTIMTFGLPINSFWRPLKPWVGILIVCQLLCHAIVRLHLELLYQS